ncbi:MAG: hypothetical protein ACN6N5_00260, partial [Diaphorobacter nitroreducens]
AAVCHPVAGHAPALAECLPRWAGLRAPNRVFVAKPPQNTTAADVSATVGEAFLHSLTQTRLIRNNNP